MTSCKFLTFGTTPALGTAVQLLKGWGYSFTDTPDSTVTHLLLPVPAFAPDGNVKGGGPLEPLIKSLPHTICVIGGNLSHPALQSCRRIDLLQDAIYLSENAYITAHCALRLALSRLPVALRGCKVLIIGWGRIGKCLAAMLKSMEADVTVAARKENDRAMLLALGYKAIGTEDIAAAPYRVIFNTAPKMVLPESPPGALKIDLASKPGIGGDGVIWARGLPGKDAPETSGELIARTVIRLLREDIL